MKQTQQHIGSALTIMTTMLVLQFLLPTCNAFTTERQNMPIPTLSKTGLRVHNLLPTDASISVAEFATAAQDWWKRDDDDDNTNAKEALQESQQKQQHSTLLTTTTTTINLVKSLLGAGALALPAGMAAIGDPMVTILLLVAMAAIQCFFFCCIGDVCEVTKAKSYAEAFEKTVGYKEIADVMIILKTAMACVGYSMILADNGASLLGVSRLDALGLITFFGILPMCNVKNLNSLAPFSSAGVAGFLGTMLAMGWRKVDGSYQLPQTVVTEDIPELIFPDNSFLGDLAVFPSFAQHNGIDWAACLAVSCTLMTAFVAHYNAPRFRAELQESSSSDSQQQQQQQFANLSIMGFSATAVIIIIMAVIGFGTFGDTSASNILNNYSHVDSLMNTTRLAVAMSLLVTFPFPFVGLRDSVLGMMNIQDSSLWHSAALLGLLTAVAACVDDLGSFLCVGGGTIGTTIAAVLPNLMYQSSFGKDDSKALQRTVGNILMTVSVAIGVSGVSLSLLHY